ncbi:PREDICTED: uncharacterized protein LOC109344411 isoform X2 [Lupinus angustifolius]|uniref:uncharacterized protein LOC109344411 isoform X2 n=1 Tax=Lupinus angustifolius TaxID=3871 RepID=UPI00092F157A|nr:PREDICTED: uncharacterized protein LOC109344411 isoform X2 [Lupinus angustifolius]
MNNDEDCNSEQSMLTHRSHSKLGSINFGKKNESPRKRVKMRDLDSITQSSESNTNYSEFTNDQEHIIHQMSQMTKLAVTVDMDASKEAKSGRKTFKAEVNLAASPLDLNKEPCSARYSSLDKGGGCVTLTKVSLTEKRKREQHSNFVKSKGINVDLNADDAISSVNLKSAHSQKAHRQFKSKDVSESASCTGRPTEEKDPMRIWKEMKQNGFLSSSHGGIPMPKPCERKSTNNMLKKNLELAKREQINKFTKIAAPSGLLNDLNPGIINHVRNRKQVHSIIEALVKSEKNESRSTGRNQSSHRISGCTEVSQRDPGHTTDVGKRLLTFPHEEGNLHSSSGRRDTEQFPVTMNNSSWILNGIVSDCKTETCTIEKASLESCASHSTHVTEDGISAPKLSSSTNASMSSTNLLKEEPSNFTIVSSLSLKAATVASQWLELLHQDIKGRLLALRRSRRRVRSVITTELPFLISKEYENNQENDPHAMKIFDRLPPKKTTDLHRARWTALFSRMDEDLSEEEKQLGCWLNQVKEKQLLCDQGLNHANWSMAYGLQQSGTENNSRVSSSTIDISEKELTVNAAAASIYSTCNFLLSES